LGIKGTIVPFLIHHHTLLANISQRRDLNEEKTAVQVAQTVKDMDRLRLLFLLTAADSFATSPKAHSEWKLSLLLELFFKVSHILRGGILATPDATRGIEGKRKRLLKNLGGRFPLDRIENLMEQVSSRYFLNTPERDMGSHFTLAMTMGKKRLSWKLEKRKSAPVTRVVLCIHDRPGLFSNLVGVFTLNNVKVLSANIFTLKNGLAFDTYEVTNPLDPYWEDELWKKVHNEIMMVLEDRLPLDEMIRKKWESAIGNSGSSGIGVGRVLINNDVSDFFTNIEVRSNPRLGLLYELAKRLHLLGLDIRFAKVDRDEERMNGGFYIRDAEGQKVLDENLLRDIEDEIMSIINE
jgi:[protein-PII] uridylyltransferase